MQVVSGAKSNPHGITTTMVLLTGLTMIGTATVYQTTLNLQFPLHKHSTMITTEIVMTSTSMTMKMVCTTSTKSCYGLSDLIAIRQTLGITMTMVMGKHLPIQTISQPVQTSTIPTMTTIRAMTLTSIISRKVSQQTHVIKEPNHRIGIMTMIVFSMRMTRL